MGKNRLELSRAYAILGIEPNTTPDAVHHIYRQLVKQWHPDQFGLNTPAHQEAEARLKLINQAYGIVKAHFKNRPQTKSIAVRPSQPQQGRFSAHKTFFHTLFGQTAHRATQQPPHCKPPSPDQPPKPPPGFQQILQTAHQHPKRFKSAPISDKKTKPLVKRHPLRQRRRGGLRIETVQPISRIRPVTPIRPIGDE